ncbi:Histone-lysine N-methyltransferase SMYD3 [Trichinella britovi]|uniref:Histone-lysine N-methyltransferase SMYD3 n=1 Tax=Trichinella britovi TaxID=45882 RepID=A0A0V1CZK1_TRIBR|nr:Histone-lysine N-methyltransferase SMYD3 [Trichinella britovi]
MTTDNNSRSLVFYPFAYALLDDHLDRRCWYCLSDEQNLLRCMRCRQALFCNEQCQRLGWWDHQAECGALKRAYPVVFDVEVRLLGRIAARHMQISGGKDAVDRENFYLNRQSARQLGDLWHHVGSMRENVEEMRKFRRIQASLERFYKAKYLPNEQTLFKLHSRNYINRHAIGDQLYLNEIGKGLYLDLCAYDHSCRPNAIYTCEGFVARLKALDDSVNLSDRKRTHTCYITPLDSRAERRRLLKESWYFDCFCERCTDPNDHLLTALKCNNCSTAVPIHNADNDKDLIDDSFFTCPKCKQRCFSRPDVEQALFKMIDIEKQLAKTGSETLSKSELDSMLLVCKSVLADENVFFAKLLQRKLQLIDCNDSKQLLETSLQALPCLRVCYPEMHPTLAYHYMTIGIYYKNLADCKTAMQYLNDALRRFRFTLGSNHLLTKQCEQLLGGNNRVD